MALAQDTGILLLDEPTTYLDLAHQIDVLDLLVDLNRADGRTIVLVLHDLNQACRYSHHLVAMRGGSIVVEGAPSAVVDEGLVRDGVRNRRQGRARPRVRHADGRADRAPPHRRAAVRLGSHADGPRIIPVRNLARRMR